jgi:hypothetical protein
MNAADAVQPKLIYLARRNPALSPEAFMARWRQHGALGMSLPRWRNIARYVHCDVLCAPGSPPELDSSYDGVGLIWHRSPRARAAHLADTSSRATMEQDEARTFAAPIVTSCVLTRETILQEPRRSGQARKLMCFRHRIPLPDDGAERIYQALAAAGVPAHGHVVDTPLAPERGPWGLDVMQIEEWWFEDEAAALRAASVLQAARPGRCRLVLTNEVVLYGQ